MDKLKMHSQDRVKDHIAQIAALFPNALTETIKDGKVEQAIDFEILKQELSDIVVDGPAERYQFTWSGKKKSILLANAPIAKTLRPCREESVDFDGTQNLYIEGDNLDVLKLLQETYLNKVKLIYIDPPYNTGTDFIYEDNFIQKMVDYLPGSGQYNEAGGMLVTNLESNGRFHTDWLNMMYPRLKLAKDFLSDDGIIFISIDDNEVNNLKKICDEIFGEDNFLSLICVKMSHLSGMKMSHKDKKIPKIKEFVLSYCRNKDHLILNPVYIAGKWQDVFERYTKFVYKKTENCENWEITNLSQVIKEKKITEESDIETFCIQNAENIFRTAVNDSFSHMPKDNLFHKVTSKTGLTKYILNSEEVIFADSKLQKFGNDLLPAETIGDIWTDIGINNLHKEGEINFPNGKKPLKLVDRLINLSTSTNSSDIVFDFFSGSGTTAHALIERNLVDKGNRKYILVQMPEKTDEKSDLFNAGFGNICEIGKERIRRAGKKIKNDSGLLADNLDIGFRVLKVDNTNMEDVYYTPGSYQQNLLNSLADNIKPDRNAEDLLFQVMLDLGILLSSSIQEILVGGKKVYSVADGYLLACFDKNVNSETVTEIAKRKPYYAIFRDSSMSDDSVATNFDQIFATYSPTTVRKVL